MLKKRCALVALSICLAHLAAGHTALSATPPTTSDAAADSILDTMQTELNRAFTHPKQEKGAPLYYLAYRLYEGGWQAVAARSGALTGDYHPRNWRMLSVDLRLGSPQFDNTHFLRSHNSAPPHIFESSSDNDAILPVHGSGAPLRQTLWLSTDDAFKKAQARLAELAASNEVLAAEEDHAGDFSLQPKHLFEEKPKQEAFDTAAWSERVKRLSRIFLNHPMIKENLVEFSADPEMRYIVTSEGSRLAERHNTYRFLVEGSTLAPDGLSLKLSNSVESKDPANLPDEKVLSGMVKTLASDLDKLRAAPLAEPYSGPAILSGRAAAVFFHETFGHRIEGQRQKKEDEGKTFAKKIGTRIMPQFISVMDDPTKTHSYGVELNGSYKYDDEGVPAQPVTLVKNGVLTGFLLSRAPVQGFKNSNGHGRSSPGWNPAARQGNLMVLADPKKQVSFATLRSTLIAEAKKQHKSYGLLFDEIAGGTTWTTAETNQSYSIYPLKVYRVYVDGRPDELIRGVDIVGTPLASLERILGAGNDYAVFKGVCDAESGSVPVSASAPSLLIGSIEVKRRAKSFQKYPILPDPSPTEKGATK
ncbi:MAG: peptidase U62 [Cyanobacteria bacterium SZAS LIN-3]|nr:peptidase U62 [Cyanobacteria bacterium SZAS LIN-3]